MANFTDKGDLVAPGRRSAGPAVRQQRRDDERKNGYQQSSSNLVSFSGQVVGPFSISYASTGSCDYAGWGRGRQGGCNRRQAFSTTAYKHVSIATPPNAICGWSGLASLGALVVVDPVMRLDGWFSHELGHNLLFHHAHTPRFEYGDSSDPMAGPSGWCGPPASLRPAHRIAAVAYSNVGVEAW